MKIDDKVLAEPINLNRKSILGKTPWKSILGYVVFGLCWILFSDQLLEVLVKDMALYKTIQMYKGFLYVFITAGILYVSIKLDYRQTLKLTEEIANKNQELYGFSEELLAMDDELKYKIVALDKSLDEISLQKEFIQEIYENSDSVIMVWDLDGTILDVNQRFLDTFSFKMEEVLGEKWQYLILTEQNDLIFDKVLTRTVGSKEAQKFSNIAKDKNGNLLNMLWTDKLIINPKTDKESIVTFGKNNSDTKKFKDQIFNLAYRDSLTGLKNRVVFESDVKNYIDNNRGYILYYLDLDNFKNLNDIHGHNFGDQFLVEYSNRLKEVFKQQQIYRWGGDEFLIMSHEINDEVVKNTLKSIYRVTEKRWQFSDIEYYPSVSIGISQFPQDGNSTEDMLKNIDMALFKAKSSGKSTDIAYTLELQQSVEKKIDIENLINLALDSDSFSLVYQPIHSIKDNRIDGIEVLLRCISCTKYNIGEIIDVAEQTGQILRIDKWVIRNTFKMIKDNLMDSDVNIGINISARSIKSASIFSFLEAQLIEFKLDPRRIEFEITEYSLIDDLERTKHLVEDLKHIGFKMSLDDFGTKYSSLNYLNKIPFDYLKIDKSYIDNILNDSNDKVIIEQIIDMAQKLGLQTIAEGIETDEQFILLKQLGCDFGQGYYLDKPMPLKALKDKLF